MADALEVLKSAKNLLANGDAENALKLLFSLKEEALADYALSVKISKVSDKALKNVSHLKPLKIAIISSSTQTFLIPVLRFLLAESGFNAEIQAGDMGAWRSELADTNSWVYEFNPDIAFIATNWRDGAVASFTKNVETEAGRVVAELESFWKIFKSKSSAVLFQHSFDFPFFDSAGFLSQNNSASRIQVLKRANVLLLEKASAIGVAVLDIPEVRALVGSKNWEDERMWLSARQHPSFVSLPALGAEYARAINAAKKSPKKVCVLDLDNTLWGGVIGEDGIGGIKLGAPDPVGEGYVAFQKYLLELKERGILLAVVSKNNEEDALLPFEKHPDMILKKDDITSFKANWEAKSQNIAAIAKELNLGIDSFVFVDDNPAEIAQVNSALPEVATVLLTNDSSQSIALLDSQNFFDALFLSEDDLKRHKTYLENAKRDAAKTTSSNPKDFLKDLEMISTASDINEVNLARAAQLIGKTNQFNLTTRRHSAEQVDAIAKSLDGYAKTFNLKDKFGDMGIVGILLAKPAQESVLEIDTFLLSCRALGRTLEQFVISDLFEFAKEKGFKKIRGVYIPTAKNSQTKDIFEKFGFTKENENEEKTSWILEVEKISALEVFINKT